MNERSPCRSLRDVYVCFLVHEPNGQVSGTAMLGEPDADKPHVFRTHFPVSREGFIEMVAFCQARFAADLKEVLASQAC